MSYPRHADRAPETELRRYLDEATALFAGACGGAGSDNAEAAAAAQPLSADFEHLRWFELPADCLVPD